MEKLKVKHVSGDFIEFEDGTKIYSNHDQDCCESHYLDFSELTLSEFESLEFDLSGETFFERVEDYGIRLKPINGHPVSVPGYGYNNGYYGANIDLVISTPGKPDRKYDVSECQKCEWE